MVKSRVSDPVVAISLENENEVGNIKKSVAVNEVLGQEWRYRFLYDQDYVFH